MKLFTEEFTRFDGSHTYTITFDEDGVISHATIYIDEMNRELDITGFVSTDYYWVNRVAEWLDERAETKKEHTDFKWHKGAI